MQSACDLGWGSSKGWVFKMFKMGDELMYLVPWLGSVFFSLHVAAPGGQPGWFQTSQTWYLVMGFPAGNWPTMVPRYPAGSYKPS